MEYNEAVKRLAPCGLDCSRCANYENSDIKTASALLIDRLGNFERLAKMKEDAFPVFKGYPQFHAVLSSFAEASCSGCRGDHPVCLPQCAAKTCHRENNVDFCFQCVQYPCDKQFTGKLRERWLFINDRMKEIGPEAYCEEQAKLPRY
ncbi:MAG TPA: DUF3795 domain-containing protein [Negativicutes bacterium]|nr:DUF3795 domain-containing protein [Negativicutes bacterium]